MKRVIWLVVLAAVAYLAYLQFFPRLTEQESQVKELEKAFDGAARAFVAASRQAGETGLAAIADPEAAVRKVKEVDDKLAELKSDLTEEKALSRADELAAKIREFYTKNESR